MTMTIIKETDDGNKLILMDVPNTITFSAKERIEQLNDNIKKAQKEIETLTKQKEEIEELINPTRPTIKTTTTE